MSPTQTARQQFDALILTTNLFAPAGDGVAATEPEYRFDAERTIGSLASSLASVHRFPVQPASLLAEPDLLLTTDFLVELALRSTEAEQAHPKELSPAYRHMSRVRLTQILQDGAGAIEQKPAEPVLLQGAPRLSNLRFSGQDLIGFEDWTQAAIGDAYFDLARAAQDLLNTFGPQPIQAFFGEYGLQNPDPVRLDWYLLAAELCAEP
ncbi:MAG: phosphotransferase [Actinobacteria bacterium]|uniref:Unannotated protein n=1 Tax=freshwater metagenome TaxID=449393 RepID=A0A6J6ZJZ6_9ZZZZ|nr:phosphotransferase [Actinomycetota bacterium]MSX75802.1 phosphotransferase [Actinomycetota bacterium]MSY22452.1 phosphotransferase [Actinomycetota bacterium]MTA74930.1 phosphotransferase [Actinomycetota bacterium]